MAQGPGFLFRSMTQIVCGCMIDLFYMHLASLSTHVTWARSFAKHENQQEVFTGYSIYMIRIPWQDDKGPMTRSSIGSTAFKLGWLLEGDKTPSDLFP